MAKDTHDEQTEDMFEDRETDPTRTPFGGLFDARPDDDEYLEDEDDLVEDDEDLYEDEDDLA